MKAVAMELHDASWRAQSLLFAEVGRVGAGDCDEEAEYGEDGGEGDRTRRGGEETKGAGEHICGNQFNDLDMDSAKRLLLGCMISPLAISQNLVQVISASSVCLNAFSNVHLLWFIRDTL